MTLQQQIRSNRWRTLLLLLLFVVLIAIILLAVYPFVDIGVLSVVGIALIAYGLFMWFAAA